MKVALLIATVMCLQISGCVIIGPGKIPGTTVITPFFLIGIAWLLSPSRSLPQLFRNANFVDKIPLFAFPIFFAVHYRQLGLVEQLYFALVTFWWGLPTMAFFYRFRLICNWLSNYSKRTKS